MIVKTRRTYARLSDEQVLDEVLQGNLVIDHRRQTVRRPGGPCLHSWTRKGYRFVRIYANGGRRAIAFSRLVWMAHHRRTVPEGHDIDHRDRNPRNNRVSNLRPLPAADNRGRTLHDWWNEDGSFNDSPPERY